MFSQFEFWDLIELTYMNIYIVNIVNNCDVGTKIILSAEPAFYFQLQRCLWNQRERERERERERVCKTNEDGVKQFHFRNFKGKLVNSVYNSKLAGWCFCEGVGGGVKIFVCMHFFYRI